jgi:hypothetical protein
MKLTLKLILTISLMAISVRGYATENSVQQICKIITSGQVQPLYDILDSNIEVSILGESVVCNKDYAVNLVNDFINNNQKCVCKVSHHGKRENSSFCIISIASAGRSYRLYALFRKVSNNQLIQQFRIDDVTE